MSDVDVEILQKLHHDHRDPDPAHIAQLPKPTKRSNQKGTCPDCGRWHGLPAVHLDYMGHAEVTDVLLEADPTWTWEPFAIDTETGLPRISHIEDDLVLWVRLTIGGVSRPGVGTAPKFKGGDALKELIGDAIRNAGMRFGIALTLWSKADGVEREVEQAAGPAELPPGDSVGVVKTRLLDGLEKLGVPDPKAAAAEVWERAELTTTTVQLADGERDWVSPDEQDVLQRVTNEWLAEQEGATA